MDVRAGWEHPGAGSRGQQRLREAGVPAQTPQDEPVGERRVRREPAQQLGSMRSTKENRRPVFTGLEIEKHSE